MNDQTMTAYVIAGVITLVFVLISVLVANIIKYEGGTNPKDKKKRRIWFWVLSVFVPIVIFLICYFGFALNIKVPSLKDKFMMAMNIGTAGSFVVYVLIGFILSKIFKNGKVGHWF